LGPADTGLTSLARRRAAAASEGHVAQAAHEVLAIGNAVDAVVAGILMAAAEAPGVLLGPVQILAGGAGAGLIAIDGRVRQPGLEAPRPRGFVAGEAIPEAARVGVPVLPAAIATALATLGSVTLLRAAGPALAAARTRSPERAQLLEAIARHGAPAMTEDAVAIELTAAAGRAARGLLTPEDLAAARPVVTRCDERGLGASGVLTVPWRSEAPGEASTTHVVAAADGRGLVAIACYEVHLDGVAVPALGLLAPRLATPVLRGQPRVSPGEARAASAPIALRARQGLIDLAVGVAASPNADTSLDAILSALETVATIAEALAVAAGQRTVAIVCARDMARTLSSA
jgi:gamma-glutamyltranspeptidase/glutathione hydrolase